MKYRFRFPKLAALGLALGFSASPAMADDYTWNPTTGGTTGSANWDVNANWTSGTGITFPNAAVDTATFNDILTGNLAVTLNQSITLDSLTFTNHTTSALSIFSGGGQLTFDGSSMLTYEGSTSGNFNFFTPVTLDSDFTVTNNNTGGGLVNLTGAIDGTAFFMKTGTGTVMLGSANSYTGDTIVTGGTLQLNAPNALGDISSTSNVNIDGGTIETIDAFNIEKAGAQLVIGNSGGAITLFGGAHDLTFGTVFDSTNALTVNGWTGDVSGGTNGRILFVGYTDAADAIGQTGSFLSSVQFSNSTGTGATFIDAGSGVVQLVPVPEPATVFGISAAGLGLAGWIRRRRTVS